jgi:hypothetical protein
LNSALIGKGLAPWVAIAATVAVPIIVTWLGVDIQRTIADETNRKDYVMLAVDILSRPPSARSDPLRVWAVDIIDEKSPVRLPTAVRQGLLTGKYVTVPSGHSGVWASGATPAIYTGPSRDPFVPFSIVPKDDRQAPEPEPKER